jgi:hypothetical protein
VNTLRKGDDDDDDDDNNNNNNRVYFCIYLHANSTANSLLQRQHKCKDEKIDTRAERNTRQNTSVTFKLSVISRLKVIARKNHT